MIEVAENDFVVDSESIERYAEKAMLGLLSYGWNVSYDTAHQAFKMAKMMVEVRDQYVS